MGRMFNAMTIAAALALAAPVAFGQTTLKADVPFAFVAGGVQWPAGEYEVRSDQQNGSAVVTIRNAESGRGAVMLAQSPLIGKSLDQPKLMFKCGDGPCRMAEVWDGRSTGWQLALPRGKQAAVQYTAAVRLQPREIH